MRHHHSTALLFALLVASAGQAGIPTGRWTITAAPGNYFVVVKGKLGLDRPSRLEEGKDGPDRWHINATQIKSSVGGYLTFDPSGKDGGKVFLAAAPVKGSGWDVRRPDKGKRKNESASVGEDWGHIRVASGPMKGWYLDVDTAESEVGGKRVVTCRFVLRKVPKRAVEAGMLYRHL